MFQFLRVSSDNVQNLFQTSLILLSMAGLFGLIGWLIFGVLGIFWAMVAVLIIMAFTPRLSPPMILRMYNARPLSFHDAPWLYRIVYELSRRADLPSAPMLHHVPTGSMNAFSVGSREGSSIALSDGLIRNMSPREIAGVLAHEISHIRSNDLKIHTLADMITRITSLFSFFGQILVLVYLPIIFFSDVQVPYFLILLLLTAPSISVLLQLALSRAREFVADTNAVRITGDPQGLASALRKMETIEKGMWGMFPFPGRKSPHPSILRTHPDTKNRVERLMRLDEKSDDIYELFDRAGRLPDRFSGSRTDPGTRPLNPRR